MDAQGRAVSQDIAQELRGADLFLLASLSKTEIVVALAKLAEPGQVLDEQERGRRLASGLPAIHFAAATSVRMALASRNVPIFKVWGTTSTSFERVP